MLKNLPIAGTTCTFDLPDICPHCGIGMIPKIIAMTIEPPSAEYAVTLQCPACKRLFFCTFNLYQDHDSRVITSEKRYICPWASVPVQLPKEISAYYQDFYEIYSQAAEAENHNLHKLVGMAYRKSLENLVKNYLIDNFPSEQSDILKEPLGKSIARIQYPKIQSLAKAATWIGNDQTHMVQKNPDYNVNDMKAFILALCHLILAEKEADKALSMLSSS